MRTYTLELYKPFPHSIIRTRVHFGSFESNRDCLSPSMIKAREVRAQSKKSAEVKASALLCEYHEEQDDKEPICNGPDTKL